jgi:HK97 gp10 family phage protein
MANRIEIKLTGFKELGEALKQLPPKIARNGLRGTALAGAQVVRDATKETAPVRSGFLKANIANVKRRSGSGEIAVYRVTTRKNVKAAAVYEGSGKKRKLVKKKLNFNVGGPYYGKYVEFGTSRMKAKPFMRPAFFSNINRALEAMKARMARAVDENAKK